MQLYNMFANLIIEIFKLLTSTFSSRGEVCYILATMIQDSSTLPSPTNSLGIPRESLRVLSIPIHSSLFPEINF